MASTSIHSLSSTFIPSRASLTANSHAPPSSATFRRQKNFPVASSYTATAPESGTTTATTAALAAASLYQVLGVHDFATKHEVKAAYRKLARVLHPDVCDASSSDDFIRVHEAYATLSDPRKRADYDRMLLCKRHRIAYSPSYAVGAMSKCGTSSSSGSSGFSGYTRRSWETDQCW